MNGDDDQSLASSSTPRLEERFVAPTTAVPATPKWSPPSSAMLFPVAC